MMRIRAETIKYASLKKKKELEREQNLMTDIEFIEKNEIFASQIFLNILERA